MRFNKEHSSTTGASLRVPKAEMGSSSSNTLNAKGTRRSSVTMKSPLPSKATLGKSSTTNKQNLGTMEATTFTTSTESSSFVASAPFSVASHTFPECSPSKENLSLSTGLLPSGAVTAVKSLPEARQESGKEEDHRGEAGVDRKGEGEEKEEEKKSGVKKPLSSPYLKQLSHSFSPSPSFVLPPFVPQENTKEPTSQAPVEQTDCNAQKRKSKGTRSSAKVQNRETSNETLASSSLVGRSRGAMGDSVEQTDRPTAVLPSGQGEPSTSRLPSTPPLSTMKKRQTLISLSEVSLPLERTRKSSITTTPEGSSSEMGKKTVGKMTKTTTTTNAARAAKRGEEHQRRKENAECTLTRGTPKTLANQPLAPPRTPITSRHAAKTTPKNNVAHPTPSAEGLSPSGGGGSLSAPVSFLFSDTFHPPQPLPPPSYFPTATSLSPAALSSSLAVEDDATSTTPATIAMTTGGRPLPFDEKETVHTSSLMPAGLRMPMKSTLLLPSSVSLPHLVIPPLKVGITEGMTFGGGTCIPPLPITALMEREDHERGDEKQDHRMALLFPMVPLLLPSFTEENGSTGMIGRIDRSRAPGKAYRRGTGEGEVGRSRLRRGSVPSPVSKAALVSSGGAVSAPTTPLTSSFSPLNILSSCNRNRPGRIPRTKTSSPLPLSGSRRLRIGSVVVIRYCSLPDQEWRWALGTVLGIPFGSVIPVELWKSGPRWHHETGAIGDLICRTSTPPSRSHVLSMSTSGTPSPLVGSSRGRRGGGGTKRKKKGKSSIAEEYPKGETHQSEMRSRRDTPRRGHDHRHAYLARTEEEGEGAVHQENGTRPFLSPPPHMSRETRLLQWLAKWWWTEQEQQRHIQKTDLKEEERPSPALSNRSGPCFPSTVQEGRGGSGSEEEEGSALEDEPSHAADFLRAREMDTPSSPFTASSPSPVPAFFTGKDVASEDRSQSESRWPVVPFLSSPSSPLLHEPQHRHRDEQNEERLPVPVHFTPILSVSPFCCFEGEEEVCPVTEGSRNGLPSFPDFSFTSNPNPIQCGARFRLASSTHVGEGHHHLSLPLQNLSYYQMMKSTQLELFYHFYVLYENELEKQRLQEEWKKHRDTAEHNFTQAREGLVSAREDVLQIEPKHLFEIQSYRTPPEVVQFVMSLVMIVLGVDSPARSHGGGSGRSNTSRSSSTSSVMASDGEGRMERKDGKGKDRNAFTAISSGGGGSRSISVLHDGEGSLSSVLYPAKVLPSRFPSPSSSTTNMSVTPMHHVGPSSAGSSTVGGILPWSSITAVIRKPNFLSTIAKEEFPPLTEGRRSLLSAMLASRSEALSYKEASYASVPVGLMYHWVKKHIEFSRAQRELQAFQRTFAYAFAQKEKAVEAAIQQEQATIQALVEVLEKVGEEWLFTTTGQTTTTLRRRVDAGSMGSTSFPQKEDPRSPGCSSPTTLLGLESTTTSTWEEENENTENGSKCVKGEEGHLLVPRPPPSSCIQPSKHWYRLRDARQGKLEGPSQRCTVHPTAAGGTGWKEDHMTSSMAFFTGEKQMKTTTLLSPLSPVPSLADCGCPTTSSHPVEERNIMRSSFPDPEESWIKQREEVSKRKGKGGWRSLLGVVHLSDILCVLPDPTEGVATRTNSAPTPTVLTESRIPTSVASFFSCFTEEEVRSKRRRKKEEASRKEEEIEGDAPSNVKDENYWYEAVDLSHEYIEWIGRAMRERQKKSSFAQEQEWSTTSVVSSTDSREGISETPVRSSSPPSTSVAPLPTFSLAPHTLSPSHVSTIAVTRPVIDTDDTDVIMDPTLQTRTTIISDECSTSTMSQAKAEEARAPQKTDLQNKEEEDKMVVPTDTLHQKSEADTFPYRIEEAQETEESGPRVVVSSSSVATGLAGEPHPCFMQNRSTREYHSSCPPRTDRAAVSAVLSQPDRGPLEIVELQEALERAQLDTQMTEWRLNTLWPAHQQAMKELQARMREWKDDLGEKEEREEKSTRNFDEKAITIESREPMDTALMIQLRQKEEEYKKLESAFHIIQEAHDFLLRQQQTQQEKEKTTQRERQLRNVEEEKQSWWALHMEEREAIFHHEFHSTMATWEKRWQKRFDEDSTHMEGRENDGKNGEEEIGSREEKTLEEKEEEVRVDDLSTIGGFALDKAEEMSFRQQMVRHLQEELQHHTSLPFIISLSQGVSSSVAREILQQDVSWPSPSSTFLKRGEAAEGGEEVIVVPSISCSTHAAQENDDVRPRTVPLLEGAPFSEVTPTTSFPLGWYRFFCRRCGHHGGVIRARAYWPTFPTDTSFPHGSDDVGASPAPLPHLLPVLQRSEDSPRPLASTENHLSRVSLPMSYPHLSSSSVEVQGMPTTTMAFTSPLVDAKSTSPSSSDGACLTAEEKDPFSLEYSELTPLLTMLEASLALEKDCLAERWSVLQTALSQEQACLWTCLLPSKEREKKRKPHAHQPTERCHRDPTHGMDETGTPVPQEEKKDRDEGTASLLECVPKMKERRSVERKAFLMKSKEQESNETTGNHNKIGTRRSEMDAQDEKEERDGGVRLPDPVATDDVEADFPEEYMASSFASSSTGSSFSSSSSSHAGFPLRYPAMFSSDVCSLLFAKNRPAEGSSPMLCYPSSSPCLMAGWVATTLEAQNSLVIQQRNALQVALKNYGLHMEEGGAQPSRYGLGSGEGDARDSTSHNTPSPPNHKSKKEEEDAEEMEMEGGVKAMLELTYQEHPRTLFWIGEGIARRLHTLVVTNEKLIQWIWQVEEITTMATAGRPTVGGMTNNEKEEEGERRVHPHCTPCMERFSAGKDGAKRLARRGKGVFRTAVPLKETMRFRVMERKEKVTWSSKRKNQKEREGRGWEENGWLEKREKDGATLRPKEMLRRRSFPSSPLPDISKRDVVFPSTGSSSSSHVAMEVPPLPFSSLPSLTCPHCLEILEMTAAMSRLQRQWNTAVQQLGGWRTTSTREEEQNARGIPLVEEDPFPHEAIERPPSRVPCSSGSSRRHRPSRRGLSLFSSERAPRSPPPLPPSHEDGREEDVSSSTLTSTSLPSTLSPLLPFSLTVSSSPIVFKEGHKTKLMGLQRYREDPVETPLEGHRSAVDEPSFPSYPSDGKRRKRETHAQRKGRSSKKSSRGRRGKGELPSSYPSSLWSFLHSHMGGVHGVVEAGGRIHDHTAEESEAGSDEVVFAWDTVSFCSAHRTHPSRLGFRCMRRCGEPHNTPDRSQEEDVVWDGSSSIQKRGKGMPLPHPSNGWNTTAEEEEERRAEELFSLPMTSRPGPSVPSGTLDPSFLQPPAPVQEGRRDLMYSSSSVPPPTSAVVEWEEDAVRVIATLSRLLREAHPEREEHEESTLSSTFSSCSLYPPPTFHLPHHDGDDGSLSFEKRVNALWGEEVRPFHVSVRGPSLAEVETGRRGTSKQWREQPQAPPSAPKDIRSGYSGSSSSSSSSDTSSRSFSIIKKRMRGLMKKIAVLQEENVLLQQFLYGTRPSTCLNWKDNKEWMQRMRREEKKKAHIDNHCEATQKRELHNPDPSSPSCEEDEKTVEDGEEAEKGPSFRAAREEARRGGSDGTCHEETKPCWTIPREGRATPAEEIHERGERQELGAREDVPMDAVNCTTDHVEEEEDEFPLRANLPHDGAPPREALRSSPHRKTTPPPQEKMAAPISSVERAGEKKATPPSPPGVFYDTEAEVPFLSSYTVSPSLPRPIAQGRGTQPVPTSGYTLPPLLPLSLSSSRTPSAPLSSPPPRSRNESSPSRLETMRSGYRSSSSKGGGTAAEVASSTVKAITALRYSIKVHQVALNVCQDQYMFTHHWDEEAVPFIRFKTKQGTPDEDPHGSMVHSLSSEGSHTSVSKRHDTSRDAMCGRAGSADSGGKKKSGTTMTSSRSRSPFRWSSFIKDYLPHTLIGSVWRIEEEIDEPEEAVTKERREGTPQKNDENGGHNQEWGKVKRYDEDREETRSSGPIRGSRVISVSRKRRAPKEGREKRGRRWISTQSWMTEGPMGLCSREASTERGGPTARGESRELEREDTHHNTTFSHMGRRPRATGKRLSTIASSRTSFSSFGSASSFSTDDSTVQKKYPRTRSEDYEEDEWTQEVESTALCTEDLMSWTSAYSGDNPEEERELELESLRKSVHHVLEWASSLPFSTIPPSLFSCHHHLVRSSSPAALPEKEKEEAVAVRQVVESTHETFIAALTLVLGHLHSTHEQFQQAAWGGRQAVKALTRHTTEAARTAQQSVVTAMVFMQKEGAIRLPSTTNNSTWIMTHTPMADPSLSKAILPIPSAVVPTPVGKPTSSLPVVEPSLVSPPRLSSSSPVLTPSVHGASLLASCATSLTYPWAALATSEQRLREEWSRVSRETVETLEKYVREVEMLLWQVQYAFYSDKEKEEEGVKKHCQPLTGQETLGHRILPTTTTSALTRTVLPEMEPTPRETIALLQLIFSLAEERQQASNEKWQ